jgi:hypothetical protein
LNDAFQAPALVGVAAFVVALSVGCIVRCSSRDLTSTLRSDPAYILQRARGLVVEALLYFATDYTGRQAADLLLDFDADVRLRKVIAFVTRCRSLIEFAALARVGSIAHIIAKVCAFCVILAGVAAAASAVWQQPRFFKYAGVTQVTLSLVMVVAWILLEIIAHRIDARRNVVDRLDAALLS